MNFFSPFPFPFSFPFPSISSFPSPLPPLPLPLQLPFLHPSALEIYGGLTLGNLQRFNLFFVIFERYQLKHPLKILGIFRCDCCKNEIFGQILIPCIFRLLLFVSSLKSYPHTTLTSQCFIWGIS